MRMIMRMIARTMMMMMMMMMATTVLAVITTTATNAYAAQHYDEEYIVMRELDANSQRIISDTISKLQTLINDTEKFGYVMLYDGGRVEIFWSEDTGNYTNTVSIFADNFHNYTMANGYEFRRDEIIKPDGTPLFQ
jgi:hypothetical protein